MIRALALTLALSAGAAPAARGDDLADAKASFKRGVELYNEKRWAEAMAAFQAAYRARPHGALHFNIAQCRERLDDLPGAIRSYHDYLRELPGATDRDAVRGEVKRLEGKLATQGVQTVLVDSTPPGARVAVEGTDRGLTPLHVVLRPGAYAVAVSLDGHAPWAQKVEVGGAASLVVDAQLKPTGASVTPLEPSAAPRSSAPVGARPSALATTAGAPAPVPATAVAPARRYLPAWIAAGAAVVATAAAVALSVSARADERAIDALPAPDGATASSKASSATSKRRTATALYGLAGGAALAGATLFTLEWKF